MSGFLTGLQVVFTPVLGWVLLRGRPSGWTWVAVLAAITGLAVMTFRGVPLGIGEELTVVSAALFALQIVGLEWRATVKDAYGLATVQLLTVGAVSLAAAAPSGVRVPSTTDLWGAVLLTAVAATAFAFVVQTWAQSHLSATSASVVFTTEPVFAALFAWAAGEHMGRPVIAGGGLVVLAMVLMGVKGRRPAPISADVRARAPAPATALSTRAAGSVGESVQMDGDSVGSGHVLDPERLSSGLAV